jgi:hypothetical protein
MVIGAFANSSLFLLEAMFPILDPSSGPAEGLFPAIFHLYTFASVTMTTYGFGAAAITVFWSTFRREPGSVFLEK